MKASNMAGAMAFLSAAACQEASVQPADQTALYFGQTPPGDVPAVFAPGIVSKEDRFEQFLSYAPDESGLTYGLTNADWSEFPLLQMTLEDGEWTEAEPAPFLGRDPQALTVAFSIDMRRVFFAAARPSYPPADIFMSERSGESWSEPIKVAAPVSSGKDEFEVSIAGDATLYFSSSREGGEGDLDIYRAPLTQGVYSTAENLGPPINTAWGDDLPFIAPDGSYLLFASSRPGGVGERDLYITFRLSDAWSAPQSLGSSINTKDWEIYPSVSPDGKYLFFTRRIGGFQATEDSDIYWVSAEIIDRLRQTARPPTGAASQ